MAELPDYDLKTADEPQFIEPPITSRGPIFVALIVVVILGAIAAYVFYTTRHPASPPQTAARSAESPQAAARPLGGTPEAITVPPLDESDGVVRDLVRKITIHPAVQAWLTTNGVVRNFAVVVENLFEGVTPARHLRVLQPKAPFKVLDRNGQLFIDPQNYERYDGVGDAAASLDPAASARVYATLKPRIEEAYSQLGGQPGSLDRALERAIVSLLQVRAIDGPVRVEPKGGTAYQYADPNLEKLTAAQKQLLRTGPRNVRMIQSALRQIAVALGIPQDRLP